MLLKILEQYLKKRISAIVFALSLLQIPVSYAQSPLKLTVQVNHPVADIEPTMWGIFFEDINFSADGGLYAELIKNRSFEFAAPLMGWEQKNLDGSDATLLIENRSNTDTSNPRYAVLRSGNGDGAFTLTNEGFRGMGLQKGEQYNFSMQSRLVSGNIDISIEAVDANGDVIGSAKVEDARNNWQTSRANFVCSRTSANAKLKIIFKGKGKLEMDMLSMFPKDTWKGRPNGLRADLAQMLANLHPGFMRFPGGCIVEGRDLANRYQWKKTVGDINDRQLIINRWNTEFSFRSTPDYFQTFGLGFFEYFQLCEDIGASPLPILNCGMACQYNSAEVVAVNQLDPYIQDALDLIEFANGDITTKWGALRAGLGHPAPFHLKMLGVGNEQWGDQYVERYKLFSAALKKSYPQIKLVSSAGPNPDGDLFNYLNKAMRAEHADLIDEHYYRSPEWFLKNATRYDDYERNGTKIFAGEYAAHIDDNTQKDTHAESHNTWWAALTEAAFMTGLERNAGVVHMASYAPLLANVNAWQWRPDLIWFDNLHTVATPNYYVQQAFATYKGNVVLPVNNNNGQAVMLKDSLYYSATLDSQNHKVIVKIINVSEKKRNLILELKGKDNLGKQAKWITITNPNKLTFNSLEQPKIIQPAQQNLIWNGDHKTLNISGLSANVLIIPYNTK